MKIAFKRITPVGMGAWHALNICFAVATAIMFVLGLRFLGSLAVAILTASFVLWSREIFR